MDVRVLIGGVFTIIVGALFLMVGVQAFGSIDNSFNCADIQNGNGSAACDTTKNVSWTLFKLMPYGLLLGGIGIIFLGIKM